MPINLEEIRDIHKQSKLAGRDDKTLLKLPDEVLNYVVAVLRGNEPVVMPCISLEVWQSLIDLLGPQRILPVFYWRVSSLPKESRPPEEIFFRLKNIYLVSVTQSLRIEKQIADIQKEFDKNSIQVLVLKGPALAKLIYPKQGLRPSTDIDLLVRQNDVIQAGKILNSLGYASKSDYFELFRGFTIEDMYDSKDKYKRRVELHWDVHNFFQIKRQDGVEKLFERAVKGCLCPVDALIHASVHMSMTHYKEITLMWIMDIALLMQHIRIPQDWLDLKNTSMEWQVRPAVDHSIKLAQSWFGIKLPAEFEDFTLNPTFSKMETRVWADARKRFKNVFSMLSIRGANSFTSIWRFIFPPARIMKERFNVKYSWQIPWSYVKRWMLLFRRS